MLKIIWRQRNICGTAWRLGKTLCLQLHLILLQGGRWWGLAQVQHPCMCLDMCLRSRQLLSGVLLPLGIRCAS